MLSTDDLHPRRQPNGAVQRGNANISAAKPSNVAKPLRSWEQKENPAKHANERPQNAGPPSHVWLEQPSQHLVELVHRERLGEVLVGALLERGRNVVL
jgi:hypothetical protein